MKKTVTLFAVLCYVFALTNAQTPFQRIYTTLNTKCQNQSCHSAASAEALKFDGTESDVYSAIYKVLSQYPSSVAKHEELVKQGDPYNSFLLRKIAGAGFDTDLAIDTATEGALMLDTAGNPLTNKEIEFMRQWIMFGAKQNYTGNEAQPDWQLVSDYYDNPAMPFLPKPIKPAAGMGIQLRMGPVFLPISGKVEQEWLLQHEVNFPYLPQITGIDGFMNQQSHHFLLFQFPDSVAAADRGSGDFEMKSVSLSTLTTSFDGNKNLTGAWQDDAEIRLPQGTALFWNQKCYLDFNYHTKNYNATSVLPCDFYMNIYFEPRDANTIEMKSNLVNNAGLFLPQGNQSRDYDDPDNNSSTKEVRYFWMASSHAHKYATDFDIYIRDTTGAIGDKIYEGFYDYKNHFDRGYFDWEHPSIEYWPDLLPVAYGKHNGHKSGLVARTTWNVGQPLVTFGLTTSDEMQLFYYMYTSEPTNVTSAINDNTQKGIYLQVYPNPMNGSGKIVYTLNKAATVHSEILDVTGKKVATLATENEQEGVHQMSIGTTENLAKGIYFIRLSVDGEVYTKKFIVTE